jgi:hypothetical protein
MVGGVGRALSVGPEAYSLTMGHGTHTIRSLVRDAAWSTDTVPIGCYESGQVPAICLAAS